MMYLFVRLAISLSFYKPEVQSSPVLSYIEASDIVMDDPVMFGRYAQIPKAYI